MANWVRPCPEATHRRDGEHTKPKHLESDFDLAEGRRRGASGRRHVYTAHDERVRSPPPVYGRPTQRHARRHMSHAHRGVLCLPECLWDFQSVAWGRQDSNGGRPCHLSLTRSQSSGGARRAVWKCLAYPALVCDEYGGDYAWIGAHEDRVDQAHLVIAIVRSGLDIVGKSIT